MPFGPELRFPARVVDEHEIPAGKIEFRLDESLPSNSEIGWRGGKRVIQGGGKQTPPTPHGVRGFSRGEPPPVGGGGGPFPHPKAVGDRARAPVEQRKQDGLL